MSTAEHTDALTRRIEQLAAAALDEGDGAALAALIAALRSEIGAVRVDVGSLRSEAGGLRTDLDGLEARLVASVDAGRRETTSLLRRFAGELDQAVSAARGDAAQAATSTGTSLEDARGVLESRLAVLEDALDGLSERVEALARDGAVTTTRSLQELAGAVRELDGRLSAQGAQLEARVTDSQARLAEALEAARSRAAQDRASLEELAATAGTQLTAMTQVLERTLSGLQATVGEQSAGVAALTGRFAGLGHELAARLAELTTVVDDRTSELRTDVTERLAQLEEQMGSFRTEWPTRTHEVVQGARAVAEGVTREVRAQVEAQLDRVRGELARGVGEIAHTRDGLDSHSTRLAEAGKVLVAYLEQRDRLLEAERDRVLHDVLDSFAAGLSSRERTALASRMGDAVARRRDARDAERYRSALSDRGPTAGAGLPPELTSIGADDVVRALSSRAPYEPSGEPTVEAPGPAEGLRSVHPPSTSRGALAPPEPEPAGMDPAGPPARVRSLPASRAVAPGGSVVLPPAGADRAVGPVKRPSGAPGAPSRKPAPPAARKPAAGRAPARRAGTARAPVERRARLEVMPQVPSVDVALDPGGRVPPEPADLPPLDP